MRVDLSRTHIAVTKLLLYRPDIHPSQEQMGGERVTQRVTTRGLVDTGFLNSLLNRFLNATPHRYGDGVWPLSVDHC